MPRLSGSANISDYKYSVEELENENVISTKFYRTQKEIQLKYNLKRSAVYFLLHNNY